MIRKATLRETDQNMQTILKLIYDVLITSKVDFINNPKSQIIEFVEKAFKLTANPWSFENCYVSEINQKIVGIAIIWKGTDTKLMRDNQKIIWKEFFNEEPVLFLSGIESPESLETEEDELYLYALSIDANHQGQGLGKRFLNFTFDLAQKSHLPKVSLYAEFEKPLVIKLYEKIGFKMVLNYQDELGKFVKMI